ncbi:hypothetical protein ABTD62_21965, partial [Acinetobacter baumannii]
IDPPFADELELPLLHLSVPKICAVHAGDTLAIAALDACQRNLFARGFGGRASEWACRAVSAGITYLSRGKANARIDAELA